MASTTRAFVIGAGTTFTILAAGFAGGLMLAKSVMEPIPSAQTRSAAERLPAVRVILPASAEAANPREASAIPARPEGPAQAVVATQSVAEPALAATPAAALQIPEKDRQAEQTARRKAEADERRHRQLVAERKARQDAARIARRMQQQEQDGQRREPRIMAFGEDQSRGFGPSLFGN